MESFKVLAHWDPEAGVWWAESNDIKGLVAEAETMESLVLELRQIVPESMHLNHGMRSQSVEINLIADRTEGVRIPA